MSAGVLEGGEGKSAAAAAATAPSSVYLLTICPSIGYRLLLLLWKHLVSVGN